MTEDKLRRMVTGGVAAATTMIALLLTVLMFLVGTLIVKRVEYRKLSAEYTQLIQQIDEKKTDLELAQSEKGKWFLAWEYDFRDFK